MTLTNNNKVFSNAPELWSAEARNRWMQDEQHPYPIGAPVELESILKESEIHRPALLNPCVRLRLQRLERVQVDTLLSNNSVVRALHDQTVSCFFSDVLLRCEARAEPVENSDVQKVILEKWAKPTLSAAVPAPKPAAATKESAAVLAFAPLVISPGNVSRMQLTSKLFFDRDPVIDALFQQTAPQQLRELETEHVPVMVWRTKQTGSRHVQLTPPSEERPPSETYRTRSSRTWSR